MENNNSKSITNYFSHCLGVFEGGGVRAAAHAGAYSAAEKAGIRFEKIAGTSAGSIVAALIAAGAKSEYINECLLSLDFKQFTSPPEKEKIKFFPVKAIEKIFIKLPLSQSYKKLREIYFHSGMYSSNGIECWIEEQLKNLLKSSRDPNESGSIKFRELKDPLYIVAADIVSGSPKIWSSVTTPGDSVAFAVRCSCTIPFFYQAVPSDNSLMVDGGVISNLPSFIFSNESTSPKNRSELTRILAFKLIEDEDKVEKPKNLFDFCSLLSNTVVSGGSRIQTSLQREVYYVNIKTGKIKSTDFDKINDDSKKTLFKAGESAVEIFIKSENTKIKPVNFYKDYTGFDQKMFVLVDSLNKCKKTFFFSGNSTYWLDFIFPTILTIARENVQITCVTTRPTKNDEERRQELLKKLGGQIIHLEKEEDLPFNGFLIDLENSSGKIILSENINSEYQDQITRQYSTQYDSALASIFKEKIKKFNIKNNIKNQITFAECSESTFKIHLKKVPQYSEATIKFEKIDVDDNIFVLQKKVKEFKVLQIKKHINNLNENTIELFKITTVDFGDGTYSIVTPPILEKHGDGYYLIDGNTRLFHCLRNGIKKIYAVIVEGVKDELPTSITYPLSKLQLTTVTKSIDENFENLKREHFRNIEHALHPYPLISRENAK